MDGRSALTTMGSTGNNKNDDNTSGRPGPTGVARQPGRKYKARESTKDAGKLH